MDQIYRRLLIVSCLILGIILSCTGQKNKSEKPYGLYDKPEIYKKANNIPDCYLFPDFFYQSDMANRIYHQFIGKDTLVVVKQSPYPPYRMKGLALYSFPESKLLFEIPHKKVSGLLGSVVHVTKKLEIITWEGYYGKIGVYDGNTGRVLKVSQLYSDMNKKKFFKRELVYTNDTYAFFYDSRDETFTIFDYRNGRIENEVLPPVGYKFSTKFEVLEKQNGIVLGIFPAKTNLDSVKVNMNATLNSDNILKKDVSFQQRNSYLLFNSTVTQQEQKTGLFFVPFFNNSKSISIIVPADSLIGDNPVLLDFVVNYSDTIILARYNTAKEIVYINYFLNEKNQYIPKRILKNYAPVTYSKGAQIGERVIGGVLTFLSSGKIQDAANIALNTISTKSFNFPLMSISPDGKYIVQYGYNYFWNRQVNQILELVPPGGTSIIDSNTGELIHFHCNDQVKLSYPIDIGGVYFHPNGNFLTDRPSNFLMGFKMENLKKMKSNPNSK